MNNAKTIWIYPKKLVEHKPFFNILQNSLDDFDLVPLNELEEAQGTGILYLEEIHETTIELVNTICNADTSYLLILLAQQFQDQDSSNLVWQLLQAGASDVLIWDEFHKVEKLIPARFKRWQAVNEILESDLVKNNLIGKSKIWKKTLRQVIEAACYTQEPVLLVGETGTGKELAARLIHTLDERRNKHNLVTVDCTSINLELSGSELFGHERGAFTGAVAPRDGAFAMAQDGTLFLDEVGELPISLQVQILRAIQEHTYRRVGSNVWRKVDFRLICATNRNLMDEMEKGNFRSDLYYRIANWTIGLPTLEERREDIPLLVQYFLRKASEDFPAPEMEAYVKQYLLSRHYSGNVRELRNLIYRIYSHSKGMEMILLSDIPSEEWPKWKPNAELFLKDSVQPTIKLTLENFDNVDWRKIEHTIKDIVFQTVLTSVDKDTLEAARRLNVTSRTVQIWQRQNTLYYSRVPKSDSLPE
jgi:transcriptional regulator with GAF, ATPase, and Fis domain